MSAFDAVLKLFFPAIKAMQADTTPEFLGRHSLSGH